MMATTTQSRGADQAVAQATPQRRRISITPYLFILPHLIFFAAFLAWPFFYGLYISLFEFDFLRPERRPFVGLNNYIRMFDPGSTVFRDFWRAMGNTGEFLLWSVPPLVILALFLALLLNGKYPGRSIFRTIFFAPYALSAPVAGVLWWWIFQNQGGLLNTFLGMLGIKGPQWLSSMPEAWVAITVCTIWWTIGFNTVIFLAALQDIPNSLYEAAAIDGANGRQQFTHVTFPLLRPVLTFVITITLLASANLFAQPYIMTAGGPLQQTESVIYRIYIQGILRSQMGMAAAMSVFIAALLLVLTALNFKLFGRTEQQ
jgi:multiple sugar transport system permease protein